MKIYLLLLLLYPLFLFAQSPSAFNYQGIARDDQGQVYGSQDISLELSLVRNFEAGPIDFTEEHFVTTNEFGLFTVQIGKGDPVLGNLDALEWANNQYYLSVSFDPLGGRNFTELGITQLLSVPYAMHAVTASNASGAGSDDQILDLNGSVLTIEGGNSVDLSMLSGSTQNLAINGNELSISGGNSITLPNSDPQTLTINGSNLSISDGNTVTLPTSSGSSVWSENGSQISYTSGAVVVQDIQLRRDQDLAGRFNSSSSGSGQFQLFDPAGSALVTLSRATTDVGYTGVDNPANGQNIARMSGTSSQAGFIGSYGPNTMRNVALTHLSTNADHGFVGVYNAANESKASLFVNSNGQGVVNADITTTTTTHPARTNREIVYAGLAGPEVGIYHRGHANLIQGRAEIHLPDHFRMMADTSTYTISLTPYSTTSKGLAVDRKTSTGYVIGELFDGVGNYRFDWEVKAVRKDYTEFDIIREKDAKISKEKTE